MSIAATYDTQNPGAAVSNYEGLTPELAIMEPEETPFFSMLTKKPAPAKFVEVTMDKRKEPETDTVGEAEDVDSFENKLERRVRSGVYCQKQRETYFVSEDQDNAESVGPANLAFVKAAAGVDLKRKVEKSLLGNTQETIQGSGTDDYKMRDLGTWLDPTNENIPEGYRTPSTSVIADASADFSETALLDLITSMYRVNGKVNSVVLLSDTTLRRKISDFSRLGDSSTTIRKVNYVGGSTELSNTVDTFKSDHGIITIMNGNIDCMPTTTVEGWSGYLINPAYACIYEWMGFKNKPLPDGGAGPRGFFQYDYCLGIKHPGAHGKISD